MTRRLVAAVARVLREPQPEDRPHVHNGSDGLYVCHDPRCDSPSVV
jgi:hypothetical protein